MAVDFRCDKCGKLLSVEAEPGAEVRCPGCNKKVTVPEGLASLPRPKVPPGAEAAAGEGAAGGAQGEQAEEAPQESEAVMGVMARIMPWVISVFFHLGLGLIMAFVTLFVIQNKIAKEVVFPDAFSDVMGVSVNPGDMNPELKATQQLRRTENKAWAQREANMATDAGETDKRVELIGRGAGGSAGGPLADYGLKRGGSGLGPRTGFAGIVGNAHHIVYVIDRSGSMLRTFDYVRREMIISISRLDQNQQDFHVILFAAGPPIEKEPKRLVPATKEHKQSVARFLNAVRAEGQTNPVPALQRAFQVLQRADARPGKLVYLLTDGVFPNNKQVLETIALGNKDRDILINTYLYGDRPPEAEKVMQQIAKENGGRYRFVPPEE
mgnify:CR=1 FL=1